MEEGDFQQIALEVGKLHLTKTRLSGSTRRKLKKARESQSGARDQQQPGHVASPKPKEANPSKFPGTLWDQGPTGKP
jgi:hypothetical protein